MNPTVDRNSEAYRLNYALKKRSENYQKFYICVWMLFVYLLIFRWCFNEFFLYFYAYLFFFLISAIQSFVVTIYAKWHVKRIGLKGCGQNLGLGPWARPWATLSATPMDHPMASPQKKTENKKYISKYQNRNKK